MGPIEIFFVVIFVVLCIYFAVGSAVRYKGGVRRCPDMLPNYRFWRYVMGLLRDGFYFATSCGKYRAKKQAESKVLPTNPNAFDKLPDGEDDMDDLDDLDDEDFNEPAVAIQY